MSKRIPAVITSLLCAFLVASAQAKEKSGLITDLDSTAGTIGVLSTRTGAAIFKIDASTKFVLADGTTGTVADICQGMRVKVTTADDSDVARKIQAVLPHKKGDAKTQPAD